MDLRRPDDAQLVRRVLAGEREAFAALVDRYAAALSSIAFLRVRNTEDARDIVQQAFFTAYCSLPDLADPARFGAWIKGITLNLARKMLDERTRRQRFMERLPAMAPGPDPAEELADKQATRELMRALDGLDEPRREVVVLHYLQGMTVDAVARLISRPAGSLKRMLAEARGELRQELIEMAREEFREYQLTEEQRQRLTKIATFPRTEPNISIVPVHDEAAEVRSLATHGSFVELRVGAEACYADYDHPGGKLTHISHARVDGPLDVQGKPALREDGLFFDQHGRIDGTCRPYFHLEGDTYLYCAKQWCEGHPPKGMPLLTPDHPDWKEPQPEPASFLIVPGSREEPDGDHGGFIVDSTLYRVKIGRRAFTCVRCTGGGALWQVEWSDSPVTFCATEEFFLEDGRLLLWRRYNGLKWSEQNPGRDRDAPGTYERLAEAGMPSLDIFGHTYYLWYDQIPDYAIA